MLRWILSRQLDAAERKLGEPVDYLRHILRYSLGGFLAFARFMRLASYRKTLPASAYGVAGLVATRAEDCGTCVQIGVNLARQEGVSPDILRAVIDRRPEDLPQDLADVYHFAESIVEQRGDEGDLRERLRARYGEEGLIELALGIASCRVFPTVKRALGYATSC